MNAGPYLVGGKHDRSKQTNTDLCVGFRLRLRRKMLGLSLTDLADMAEISVEKLKCLEAGDDRVTASALFEFCTLLEVPVAWFFEGADCGVGRTDSNSSAADQDVTESVREQQDETLLRFYFDQIADHGLRRAVIDFAKLVAEKTH